MEVGSSFPATLFPLLGLLKTSIIHSKNRPTNRYVFRSVDIHMLMSYYLIETGCLLRVCLKKSWFAARNRLVYRSRFEVLTAELITIQVFWDMMQRCAQSLKIEVEKSHEKTQQLANRRGVIYQKN